MMAARTMRRPRLPRRPLQQIVVSAEMPEESWFFGLSCTLLQRASAQFVVDDRAELPHAAQ